MFAMHFLSTMNKRLLMALAGAALFAGCTNADQTAKIASKGGQGGGLPIAGKPARPGQGDTQADDTPAEVMELLKVLTQGHQIFRETWFVATNEAIKQAGQKKEEPGSPFRRLGSMIDRHRHGHWENIKNEECDKYRTRVVRTGDFSDSSREFRLDFQVLPGCDVANQDGETWASFVWRVKPRGSDQRLMKASFNRSLLAPAFGSNLANRATFGQIPKESTCEIAFDSSLRIRSMECKGLGQNITSRSYFEFESLSYGNPPFELGEDIAVTDAKTKETTFIARKGDKLVVLAKGALYRESAGNGADMSDSGWTKGQTVTTPVPLIGKIVQKIELLSVNAQESYEQMKKAAEGEEAASAAVTAESDPNSKTEEGQKEEGPTKPQDSAQSEPKADAQAPTVSLEAQAQAERLQDQAMLQSDSEADLMARQGFSMATPEQTQQTPADRDARMAEYEAQQAEYQAALAEYEARKAAHAQGRQVPSPALGEASQAQVPAETIPAPGTRRPMPAHDPVTGGPIAGDYR